MLAHEIGGVVVSADELRTALRREKVGYKNIRELSLSIGAKIVEQGGNIIINSDFIDPKKREKLNAIGKAHDVSTLYVQVVCDPDVLFGRIIEEKYGTPTSDLFAGAKSIWKGKKKGAVVKFREMWRRTPHHYTWSEEGGGQWKIKNVQNVLGIIDTTDEKKIQKQVKLLIKKLK